MSTSNKDNAGAVLYLRVASQDHGDQRHGITQQREACIREAERLGVEITAEYVDAGVSGNNMNRSGLLGLLRRVAERPVSHVIVRDRARLTRNPIDDAAISRRLEQADTTLVSAQDSAGDMPAASTPGRSAR
jgi:DNA invertase Pin-like site-specific DNA recombinase